MKITKAQKRFLSSPARGTIFQGGIGSGKTYVHCIRALMKALDGRDYCLVSFSYPALRDVSLVTLRGLLQDYGFELDADYEFNKSEMSFTFPATDGKILLRSGDRPDSLRGLNLDDFGIDEAREFKDDSIFNVMLGRIRKREDATWCITTTTKGFNWVHELAQGDESIELVTQSTMDNPFLPRAYIEELKQRYTTDFARQELYAEIVEFGAGIIKPEWFKYDDSPIEGKRIRFWDLAMKDKEHNDYSAGGLLCMGEHTQIQDIIQVKQEWHDIKETIMATAELDGPEVKVVLEEANQGYPLMQDLQREPRMSRYTITCEKPKGSKFNRAMAWVSRLEHGGIRLLRAKWNKPFIHECISFTSDDSHLHDDMIDSVSGAWQSVNGATPSIGFL